MTVKYFHTYTGCSDLFLVCYRHGDDNAGIVEVCEQFSTSEEAKAKTDLLNAADLLANVTDFTGNMQNIDDAIKLQQAVDALNQHLLWDCGVYAELRKRRKAAETAKEQDNAVTTYPNTTEGLAQAIADAKAYDPQAAD